MTGKIPFHSTIPARPTLSASSFPCFYLTVLLDIIEVEWPQQALVSSVKIDIRLREFTASFENVRKTKRYRTLDVVADSIFHSCAISSSPNTLFVKLQSPPFVFFCIFRIFGRNLERDDLGRVTPTNWKMMFHSSHGIHGISNRNI